MKHFSIAQLRIKEIVGAFSISEKHARIPNIKGNTYIRLPIRFQPMKSGLHSGYVVVECVVGGKLLNVSLKGQAF